MNGNNNNNFVIKDGVLEKYTGKESLVTVPDEVRVIGKMAFAGHGELCKVRLSGNITKIENSAFLDCDSFRDLYFDGTKEQWQDIEPDSFWTVNAEVRVHLLLSADFFPDDPLILAEERTRKSSRIHGSSFVRYNGNDSEVVVPRGITRIDNGAFKHCQSIKKILLPDTVRHIGAYAFRGCKLLEEITIPDSVETIGFGAFADCFSLTAINVGEDNYHFKSANGILYTRSGEDILQYPAGKSDKFFEIPERVRTVCESAFSGCRNLEGVIIPETVTQLSHGAFSSCINLKEMTIPGTIEKIDDFCFNICLSLEKVRISEGVKSIGAWVFSFCDKLKEISLPASLDFIGDFNFLDSRELEAIIFSGSEEALEKLLIGCVDFGKRIIRMPEPTEIDRDDEDFLIRGGTLIEYRGKSEEVTVPEGVHTIGTRAFEDRRSTTSVTLPDSVRKISAWAFGNCLCLEKINLPEGIGEIGVCAFANCIELKEIRIPKSIDTISSYCFEDCMRLNDIYLHGGIRKIGEGALSCCYSLENIYFGGTEEEWRKIEKGKDWDRQADCYFLK